MTQETLRLALEFIERVNKDGWILADFEPEMYATITAIKETLAQPEQEPVAYINVEKRILEWAKLTIWETPTVVNLPKIPLYTHPPQRTWVGIEGEEIRNLWEEATRPERSTMTMVTSFAKAIEAKLKEKNNA
jgi:hypothetical protein